MREEDPPERGVAPVVFQVPKRVQPFRQIDQMLETQVALPEGIEGLLHLGRAVDLFARRKVSCLGGEGRERDRCQLFFFLPVCRGERTCLPGQICMDECVGQDKK